jgi:hypothetical protein
MQGAIQSQFQTAGAIFSPTSCSFNVAVQNRVKTQGNKIGQCADLHTPLLQINTKRVNVLIITLLGLL